jgi:hypothetical protein
LSLAVTLFGSALSCAQEKQQQNPSSQPITSASENPENRDDEPTDTAAVAPKLNPDLLDEVKDSRLIPEADVKDPPAEARAYYQALIYARTTPPEVFARSTRRDLTYAHLFQEPWKYRGEIVHVEGQMTRLRRFDPPKFVQGEAYGITDLYEGWIFTTDTNFANPFCVIFTELPGGLVVNERLNRLASCDGYFFKKWRYKDGAGQTRDVPMLIGRSVQLKKEAPEMGSAVPFSRLLGTAFLGVLGILVLLTIALTWWYRQGDRRIHAALAASRSVAFENAEPEVEPLPEVSPVSPRNRLEDFPR